VVINSRYCILNIRKTNEDRRLTIYREFQKQLIGLYCKNLCDGFLLWGISHIHKHQLMLMLTSPSTWILVSDLFRWREANEGCRCILFIEFSSFLFLLIEKETKRSSEFDADETLVRSLLCRTRICESLLFEGL
jgi:hypothetical protein